MWRSRRLMISFIVAAAFLHLPEHAQAAPFARFRPNRMPGWDWWRIYPYSPYNRGRNPYNPYVYPVPYPVYIPYASSDDDPDRLDAADGEMAPTSQGPTIVIPQPTGEVRTPPRDAGVVQVKVPEADAQVLFDGERTYTQGIKRYFVTPSLTEGKNNTYTVGARWKKDGETVTKERQVKVSPGQTSVVDFTAGK